MRFLFWLIGLAAYAIALVVSNNHYETDFTRSQPQNAALIEKWEDWTGGTTEPYHAMFNVQVREKIVQKETKLDARNYGKAVPNPDSYSWTVKMSPKEAGARPTPAEYRTWKDSVSTFWALTGGFVFYTIMLIIWVVRSPYAFVEEDL